MHGETCLLGRPTRSRKPAQAKTALNRTAKQPTNFSPAIARQLEKVADTGIQEINNEGEHRRLLTDRHTMAAADLCPDQGADAALAFERLCRG